MDSYQSYIIKSFKHSGKLHRMWEENWLVPQHKMAKPHRDKEVMILINDQTRIVEASGDEWTSKTPGISFFVPKQWYNIVALIEKTGVRYYCNVASPPYRIHNTITYIDYDLDVIVTQHHGKRHIEVVDQKEYELHQLVYRYPPIVLHQVEAGLQQLLRLAEQSAPPFDDELALAYYDSWKRSRS